MKSLVLILSLLLAAQAWSESNPKTTTNDELKLRTPASSGTNKDTSVVDSEEGDRVIKIHHPNAAKGLIRINDDMSYQYKVKIHDKGNAASFGFSFMSPPKVSNTINGSKLTFGSMYKENPVLGIAANYEWIPFHKFGAWGVILESGLAMAHGNGVVAQTPPIQSQESYTLFVVPLTIMAKYRFEYFKKQLIVPYVEGGITYYGLMELRSDNAQTNLAGSPAAGAGGGIAYNLSRGSAASVFGLDREYGISDLWLNLEGRAMAGLKQSLDFTNTSLILGVTVDY